MSKKSRTTRKTNFGFKERNTKFKKEMTWLNNLGVSMVPSETRDKIKDYIGLS